MFQLATSRSADVADTWTFAVSARDELATGTYDIRIVKNSNAIVPTALVEYDFVYDKAGNLTVITEDQAAVADMYGFGKAASGLGMRTAQLVNALNQVTLYRQIDTATGAVTKRVDHAYRGDGSVGQVTRFAGAAGANRIGTSTATYDAMGRLTGITHAPTASPPISYGYTYDAASRMTSLTTPEGTSSFTLDATDQLLSASLTAESYAYDSTGNRTSGGTQTGSGNRLLFDGTYRYAYDAEGNRTAKFRDTNAGGTLSVGDTDVTVYGYDQRNRLVAVSHVNDWTSTQAAGLAAFMAKGTALPGSDLELRYTYDYADRRIRRMIDADGQAGFAPESVSFAAYAGDARTLEVARTDTLIINGSGQVLGFLGQVIERNFYGNGADEILAVDQVSWNGTTPTTSTFWTFTDHQDSVRDIVSGNAGSLGQVVEHRQYDSFGKVVRRTTGPQATAAATSGVGIDFGYAGRPLEARTGLSDNRARWYEPATGRFINEDPSGFKGGDANLFRYVGNDPLNQVDPSGLAAKWASYAGGISTSATMGSAVSPLGWSVFGQQPPFAATTVGPSAAAMAYAGLRGQPTQAAAGSGLVAATAAAPSQLGPTSSQPLSNTVPLGPISGWLTAKAEASRNAGGFLGAIGHMAYGTAVGPAALLDTVYPRAVPQTAFNAYAQAEKVALTSASPVDRAFATAAMGAAVYGGARATLPVANQSRQPLPAGIEYNGMAYRAVPASRVSGAWDVHAGNVAASHRYSAPGEGALYAGTSRAAVEAELTHYGVDPRAVSWASRTMSARNILDLTDPSARARLGVTLGQLITDDYSVTQALGSAARSRYDGILAPSARLPGASNLILFPTKAP